MKKIGLFLFALSSVCILKAQNSTIDSSKYPRITTFTAQQDHENMMQQLGITKLRPGPSGDANAPNHANYDEANANPCPQLPDILTTKNGKKVTDADTWWKVRRPEIIEDLEEEMYGKLPKNIPKITWTVKVTDREFVNRTPVIAKMLVGHVDNSSYPLINVDINMMLVVPMNVKGPVPVLMMFSGRPSFPAPAQPLPDDMEKINEAFKSMMIKNDPGLKEIFDRYPAYSPITRLAGPSFFAPPKPDDQLTPQERLLASGWGYVTIETNSIQADNGAGLTRGIIGLVN
ncbi:MAG: hypothetical protein ACRDE5_19030, partial [Ginsengibacter sp.]